MKKAIAAILMAVVVITAAGAAFAQGWTNGDKGGRPSDPPKKEAPKPGC